MDRSGSWRLNMADILRSMADAVITINAAKQVTGMNAAAEAMFGIAEADALGRPCSDVVRSEICLTNCPFQGVWERGESRVNFNVPTHPRSGGQLPVSICTSLLKDGSGEPIGVVGAIRDISSVLLLLGELERCEVEIARKEASLKTLLQRQEKMGKVIGRSPKMQEIFELIQVVGKSDVTVLIQGESGTGKELIASTIHATSHRAGGPFIKVSCAALPESLLESELFGHVRGAFTGAFKDRPGRFELAHGGTIFLDEVAEMSPSIQVKLLRVLQEREFERVGAARTIKVDVRIVAASNRDLQRAVQEGKFREDFFYRLNVIPIMVPPLRERKEDIPLLVSSFFEQASARSQGKQRKISPEAMNLLLEHNWPGNIRELENAVEFALVRTTGDTILPQGLPPWIRKESQQDHGLREFLREILGEREREEIVKKLAQCQGRVSDVARALGVGRTTLWRKMKSYQISKM